MHNYTNEGAEMINDSFIIPDGEYRLKIVKSKEGASKAGDYQVTCDLLVIAGDRKGFPVSFHRVTFIDPVKNPKAAGMSIYFLKTIGQPWEGKFQINPEAWINAEFIAYLAQREYNGFKSMQIKWVKPINETSEQEPDDVPASWR